MVTIKIEKFEGPLILLLRLIEKEELDITQVSLVHITDQFIEYVSKITNIDPDEMADFLVVATKLLLIKSRVLLPFLSSQDEEEGKDLVQQLKIYREFLEASQKLHKIILKKRFAFAREKPLTLTSSTAFNPPKNIDGKKLKRIFEEILEKLEFVKHISEEVIEVTISIQEKIQHIKNLIFSGSFQKLTSFKHLLKKTETRTEIIVTFLALLELVKEGEIIALQKGLFQEITISQQLASLDL